MVKIGTFPMLNIVLGPPRLVESFHEPQLYDLCNGNIRSSYHTVLVGGFSERALGLAQLFNEDQLLLEVKPTEGSSCLRLFSSSD